MNKRQILDSLHKIANQLDSNGIYLEANEITKVMQRIAQIQPSFKNKFYGGMDEKGNIIGYFGQEDNDITQVAPNYVGDYRMDIDREEELRRPLFDGRVDENGQIKGSFIDNNTLPESSKFNKPITNLDTAMKLNKQFPNSQPGVIVTDATTGLQFTKNSLGVWLKK